MKMNCFIILSLLCLLSILTVETAAMSPVTNLPAAFYDRPGLEDMPRIDYESMAVVNVLDYGAVGDGVTFVNEAFDRAVAALPPEGGVVYIPAGVYRFRPPSVSDRYYWRPQRDGRDLENVHFVGEGDKTVFLFEKNRSTGHCTVCTWDGPPTSVCAISDSNNGRSSILAGPPCWLYIPSPLVEPKRCN